MRRISLLAGLVFLTGCSNAPIAGFLDCVAPAPATLPPAGAGGPPGVPDVRPPSGPRTDTLPPPAESVVPDVRP